MNEYECIDLFKKAKKSIVVLGINPIASQLAEASEFIPHILNQNPKLQIKIFFESTTENFHQSTSYSLGEHKVRFAKLEQFRKRISGQSKDDRGLVSIIEQKLSSLNDQSKIDDLISIKQFNMKLPGNILKIDDRIFFCPILLNLPSFSDYSEVPTTDSLYSSLKSFIDTALLSDKGELYTSKVGEELIWVYDNNDTPRGIYPRKSFYTTDYGRYVVWVFIFNRDGKLLLQRRSMTTKDNRGLWDKSIGGHVDLSDASTSITAKRELIEETYLPNDEFTEHVKADLGDVVDFGELNFQKRPERHLKNELMHLGASDWAMFRATEKSGKPMKIRRVSERIINVTDTETTTKRTIFHADVYLMIAPPNEFLEKDKLNENVPAGEKSAVTGRKLLTIDELNEWISTTCEAGNEKATFTDDLLFIQTEYLDMLDEFAEFVKLISKD